MAMTKPAAIEKAIVDAEVYGYVKPGSWRSLKASSVTARELSRAIGAWPPALPIYTEQKVRTEAEAKLGA